jgi:DNA-directed RNA polymerase specialized sigma24 family protein
VGREEMDVLERMVFREMVKEALAVMTDFELLIAAGRAEGLTDEELAERLGVEPCTVSFHMAKARERIVEQIPELRVTLSGRRRRSG